VNIPIPQDIPGLITFWIFLSWIPLLRVTALAVLRKYYEFELDEIDENNDFSVRTTHAINVGVCILGLIVLWSTVTFMLLGFRLLIQMIWC
jgi:hypothetical protein